MARKKTPTELDREIRAVVYPYVDPVSKRDPNSGIKIDDTGFAALYHFALGMMESDPVTRRYEPVVNGKRVSGAVKFSVMKVNGMAPRSGKGIAWLASGRDDMKILRKAWESRRELAEFVRAHDLDRTGPVRLALKHQKGDLYRVESYDAGKDVGTVRL